VGSGQNQDSLNLMAKRTKKDHHFRHLTYACVFQSIDFKPYDLKPKHLGSEKLTHIGGPKTPESLA
jgi:hypothetical protein